MVQDRATVTTGDQYKVVHDLSIGTIFNDLDPDFKGTLLFDRRLMSNIANTVLYIITKD